MPGALPDYPAPVIRDAGSRREMVTMRWACRRHRERSGARHKHPQYFLAALAHVAQAGDPVLGPGK
jgi:hypothetical protein